MNFFEGFGFNKKKVVEIVPVPESVEMNEGELETVSIERAVELTRVDPEIQKLVSEWKMLMVDPIGDDVRILEGIEDKLRESLAKMGIKLGFVEKPYGIEGDDSIASFVDRFTKPD